MATRQETESCGLGDSAELCVCKYVRVLTVNKHPQIFIFFLKRHVMFSNLLCK